MRDLFDTCPNSELAAILTEIETGEPHEKIWEHMQMGKSGFGRAGNANWQAISGYGITGSGPSRQSAAAEWVAAARKKLGKPAP